MKTTNALKLRQSLDSILKELNKTGEPILVEKYRKPAGVLISVEDYTRRFDFYDADKQRKKTISRISNAKLKLPKEKTSLEMIQETRR